MNDQDEAEAAARGLVNGLALGLAFWLGAIVTIIAVFVLRALGHG